MHMAVVVDDHSLSTSIVLFSGAGSSSLWWRCC